MDHVEVSLTALDDPPEVKAINPVHGRGADQAGYDRPIVGGVSSYAWATAAVIQLLGDGWLDLGWAEFSLRRPVFAGDELVAHATAEEDGSCSFELVNTAGDRTVIGAAGLGLGPWHGEWNLATDRVPRPAADDPPHVLPQDVPADRDMPPMAVSLTATDATAWAAERMGDHDPRYAPPASRVHSSWLVGQGVPAIRHGMRGPEVGIHLGGRVQHLAPLQAPIDLIVAGRWNRHEQRKERWWSSRDYVFQTAAGRELAYVREDAILLPPFAD